MNDKISQHIIQYKKSPKEALQRLNEIDTVSVLFLVDEEHRLLGSLTDGDIRRGLIKGLDLNDNLADFIQRNPKFVVKGKEDFFLIKNWKELNYVIIPVVDEKGVVVDVLDLKKKRAYLPLDAVIMAGGKGSRLMPLTQDIPKPLLMVGKKPIIEHNIDRLGDFGIDNIYISINYLGHKIKEAFKNGIDKSLNIKYIEEDKPLGTIGALSKIERVQSPYVLIMNSDILTTIDFEAMFLTLLEKDADMIVATIPYEVKVPYGVVESEDDKIIGLKEKPTYTYYSNAGIYIVRTELLNEIPQKQFYNATDFIEKLYTSGNKVVHYPILEYWLDIGKPEDFIKAQTDIKHIKL